VYQASAPSCDWRVTEVAEMKIILRIAKKILNLIPIEKLYNPEIDLSLKVRSHIF
jgi:hypothetical protein